MVKVSTSAVTRTSLSSITIASADEFDLKTGEPGRRLIHSSEVIICLPITPQAQADCVGEP